MEQELLEKQELELALEEETKKKNKTKRVKQGKMALFFSNKKKWCKGYFSKDKKGRRTDIESTDSIKFCLLGGLHRCYDSVKGYSTKSRELNSAVHSYMASHPEKYGENLDFKIIGVANFNDNPKTTFKDVQEVIKLSGL